jgi:hypothetical protein
MYEDELGLIVKQTRTQQTNNRSFTFNECHPNCACNKDLCANFLMKHENKHRWATLVQRVKKSVKLDANTTRSLVMWGLFAQEFIPAGSFVVEYVGEVVTARDGDKRGRIYDRLGMSYLFDMNDFDEDDSFDKK